MKRIRDTDLRAMSADARERALSEMVRAANALPNGELAEVNAEIATYERHRGMTSAQMVDDLAAGRILETREICEWLIALRLRERLVSFAPRPQ